MGSMKDFYTRKAGNEGTKVPLIGPDGKKTDDYLIIRSVDSDAFRDAEADAKRLAIDAAKIDDINERKQLAKKAELSMIVSLVADWSLDEEFNEDNLREFLTESPQIADAVNQIAAKRVFFIEKKSKPSKRSPSTKPKAQGRRKAATPRSRSTSNK